MDKDEHGKIIAKLPYGVPSHSEVNFVGKPILQEVKLPNQEGRGYWNKGDKIIVKGNIEYEFRFDNNEKGKFAAKQVARFISQIDDTVDKPTEKEEWYDGFKLAGKIATMILERCAKNTAKRAKSPLKRLDDIEL